jgi:transposase-like protein
MTGSQAGCRVVHGDAQPKSVTDITFLNRISVINSSSFMTCPRKLLQFEVESVAQGRRTMKRSRFTEEQIIGILKEQEAGHPTADVCRWHGIGQPTFYKWNAKYGGLDEGVTLLSKSCRLPQLAVTIRTALNRPDEPVEPLNAG